MTVSAAVKLMPNPPALVLSKKILGELSVADWNKFICSRRSSREVWPSIRQISHPMKSVAQSCAFKSDPNNSKYSSYLDNIEHCHELTEHQNPMSASEEFTKQSIKNHHLSTGVN